MAIPRHRRAPALVACFLLASLLALLLALGDPGFAAASPTKASRSSKAHRALAKRCARLTRARLRRDRRCRRFRIVQARRRNPKGKPAPASESAPAPAPEPAPAPAPEPTSEPPLWLGDFSTGGLSQWDGLNGNRSQVSRYFGVVPKPAGGPAGTNYALAAKVDANAVDGGQYGQRSLVVNWPNDTPSQNKSGGFEGAERWYRSWIWFPSDFNPAQNTAWNWVMEWHNWPDAVCCANVALSVATDGVANGGEALAMRIMGGGSSQYPVETYSVADNRNPDGHQEWFVGDPQLKRQHWYDVIVHAKWSADRTKGLVEWWLDGQLVFSRQTSTLFWYADNNQNFAGASPGPGQTYLMEGYYRPSTLSNGQLDTSVETVFHSGARIGATGAGVS
jgi:hypothetical protein